MKPPQILVTLLCAVLVVACEDEGGKKSAPVETRPRPSATAASAPTPELRLSYVVGSPLSTIRAAKAFKLRLASLGIKERQIRVGASKIDIHVAKRQAAKVKEALANGRLELYLFDDVADPFSFKKKQHAKHFEVKRESVVTAGGNKETILYLLGKPNERKQLLAYLKKQEVSAKALVGPAYAGGASPVGLRSYYVQADRSARGELLKAARAKEKDGRPILELEFAASGVNFLRWNTRQRSRFIILVDGLVIGSAQPAKVIKDGVLTVELPKRKGALEDAKHMAASLTGGKALSHLVKLKKEHAL